MSEAANYGSFKDSLRAPIHRWFTYPAGFSYRLVEQKLREYGLDNTSWVVDPFVGTGTTSIVAKLQDVNSIGVEAHPFVHWVAKVELFWSYDLHNLAQDIERVIDEADSSKGDIDCEVPALVRECFTEENLHKLLRLRNAIEKFACTDSARDFLKLSLTHTLRVVSTAGTGWPYIAPSKYQAKVSNRDAVRKSQSQSYRMYEDIIRVRQFESYHAQHQIVLGDARELSKYVPAETASPGKRWHGPVRIPSQVEYSVSLKSSSHLFFFL